MNAWFNEKEKIYQINEMLFQGKSDFQNVSVFSNPIYGRMLTLDGIVMITDTDEFVYHEMISHVPVFCHPDPKKILVIGGGDGGTVRELLRYPSIEEITLCEIDGMVIDVAKKYFPKISSGLDHPKVKVKVEDGIAYIKKFTSTFDIILIDSTDPVGPGIGLFSKDFYISCKNALKPDGLLAAQTESPWDEDEMLKRIYSNLKGGFEWVHPYIGGVPTYQKGTYSWAIATNKPLAFSPTQEKRFLSVCSDFQYLNLGLIQNIFTIPNFYSKKLGITNH